MTEPVLESRVKKILVRHSPVLVSIAILAPSLNNACAPLADCSDVERAQMSTDVASVAVGHSLCIRRRVDTSAPGKATRQMAVCPTDKTKRAQDGKDGRRAEDFASQCRWMDVFRLLPHAHLAWRTRLIPLCVSRMTSLVDCPSCLMSFSYWLAHGDQLAQYQASRFQRLDCSFYRLHS